jgi:HTH-like domain
MRRSIRVRLTLTWRRGRGCGYAKKHPRWGFRRAYHDARGEGWTVNHKKIQRLWREEGLRVPQRRRRKRTSTSTTTSAAAQGPNSVWATDFQFDATNDGRPIKMVSIVDEHTRECLGGLVEDPRTLAMSFGDDPCKQLAADTLPLPFREHTHAPQVDGALIRGSPDVSVGGFRRFARVVVGRCRPGRAWPGR